MSASTLSSLSPTTSTTVVTTPGAPSIMTVPATVRAGTIIGAGIGAAIMVFIVIFSVIWIILFSFRPAFIRRIERGEVKPAEDANSDPARCFVASLIISLLIVVIIWMFAACK